MVEVLVSLSLLVIGFLAVAGLFSKNLLLVRRSAELTEASEIGRQMLDAMQANRDAIPDPPATFLPTTAPIPSFPPPPFPTALGDHGTYQLTVKVESTVVPDMKAVEVRVSWEKGEGVRIQKLFPL